MSFSLELARPQDDAAIRRLLRSQAVPGRVRLTFEREPDYFAGCHTWGPFCQVVVARDQQGLGAVACRSVASAWIDGRIQPLGCLGHLRVDPRCQGRWIVSQGFRFMRELHQDGRTNSYLATVSEGNAQALGVLVRRPRPGFPHFQQAGVVHTLSLTLHRGLRRNRDVEEAGDADEALDFWNREAPARQFFPVLTRQDFELRLPLEGLRLCRRGGKLVGVGLLWEQSGYKQTVVRGYSGLLARVRPLWNLAARVAGAPPLPATGQPISMAYASFLCAQDARAYRALLGHMGAEARDRGCQYLMVGRCAGDPLLAAARSFPHIAYPSRLYLVGWEPQPLPSGVPYVEIASL